MIQYGFDVNKGDYDNRTALMLAVVGNHAAAVNTLLGAGADANVQDNLGHNALLEATKRGHDALIRLLIDNDAKYRPSHSFFCSPSIFTAPTSQFE